MEKMNSAMDGKKSSKDKKDDSFIRNRIKLSERLMMSASRVSICKAVADVGCDHAHSSIWLVLNGVAEKAIAMDVKEGPIEHAKANIAMYGLESKIETRLSDGLEKLRPGEVNTLLICGMGGRLTTMIMLNGLIQLGSISELVLQPQSDVGMVRGFLREHKFTIVDEDMCIEDDKFYNTIKARNDNIASAYRYVNTGVERFAPDWNNSQADNIMPDEVFTEFGQLLLERHHKVLKQYLDYEYIKCLRVKAQLEIGGTRNTADRMPEVVKRQRMIETALSYY